jgi:hypothetical protein
MGKVWKSGDQGAATAMVAAFDPKMNGKSFNLCLFTRSAFLLLEFLWKETCADTDFLEICRVAIWLIASLRLRRNTLRIRRLRRDFGA